MRYFLAAAEHLHFSRAAESLFVTQPAVSKQIRALERSLGVVLFARHHDGVALSPAGQALLPIAQQIVELDEQALIATRRAAASATTLTIGFWLAPASDVLSQVIDMMRECHPDVRIRLRRADWSEAVAGVRAGAADVGLVAIRRDTDLPGLSCHRLLVEDLLVAVPASHRLAVRESVTLADLSSEILFTVPGGAGGPGYPNRPHFGDLPEPRLEYVTTIDETIEGVALGLGVCLMTPSIALTYPHPSVRTVALTGVQSADYCVVWRREDEQRPEVQRLLTGIVHAVNSWSSAWLPTALRSPKGPPDAR